MHTLSLYLYLSPLLKYTTLSLTCIFPSLTCDCVISMTLALAYYRCRNCLSLSSDKFKIDCNKLRQKNFVLFPLLLFLHNY